MWEKSGCQKCVQGILQPLLFRVWDTLKKLKERRCNRKKKKEREREGICPMLCVYFSCIRLCEVPVGMESLGPSPRSLDSKSLEDGAWESGWFIRFLSDSYAHWVLRTIDPGARKAQIWILMPLLTGWGAQRVSSKEGTLHCPPACRILCLSGFVTRRPGNLDPAY